MCEMTEPLLGFATTGDLLAELAARMEFAEDSPKGAELGIACQEALMYLGPSILGHRAVDA